MAFLDLRRGSETGAKRVTGEGASPGDMLIGEPIGGDAAILAGDGPEYGTPRDPSEFEPGFEYGDGAGEGEEQAAAVLVGLDDLDPAGCVLGLIGAAVEADDLKAAQAAGEADGEDRAVA